MVFMKLIVAVVGVFFSIKLYKYINNWLIDRSMKPYIDKEKKNKKEK